MARLRGLILQLIISAMALHMVGPTFADNVRQNDADAVTVTPMTYETWLNFCDETIKITTEKEAKGEIVNATINTAGNSKTIVDVFGDFKEELKRFKLECDRMKKLREVISSPPDGDPADAKQKLDSNANNLGRVILMLCTDMQHAYDTYVVVRKCEEPGYNYQGAVNYLKNRIMTSVSDDFSCVRSLIAIMAPLLFTLLC